MIEKDARVHKRDLKGHKMNVGGITKRGGKYK
jgi:hypothetical protein